MRIVQITVQQYFFTCSIHCTYKVPSYWILKFVPQFKCCALEWAKTRDQRAREKLLMNQLIEIVDQRNRVVEEIDTQENRYE